MIFGIKTIRCKYESLWSKTRLIVHFDMYSESYMAAKKNLVYRNHRLQWWSKNVFQNC